MSDDGSTLLAAWQACETVFLSPRCQLLVSQVRNILTILGASGALSIPFVIWFATGRRDKRRATLTLLNTMMTAPEIADRLERMYQYRIFNEFANGENRGDSSDSPINPYEDGHHNLMFDSVTVLNYFEAACVEIDRGTVFGGEVAEAAAPTIIGVRDVVLKRYSRLTGYDQTVNYPYIVGVADWCERRAQKSKTPVQSQIPDALKPEAPN